MKKYIIGLLGSLLLMQISFAQNNSKSFTVPGTYKFTVPKGAKTLTVTLSGAGGWSGGGSSGSLNKGGKGGQVSGDIEVKEGEELIITVGTGGAPGKSAGITAIQRKTGYLAIAAGGGNGSSHGGQGGNGGPQGSGGTVGNGTFQTGNSGAGASTTVGGNGGSGGTGAARGNNGASLTGGTNNAKAVGEGWGGAGWFGGGAAATYSSTFLSGDPYASGGGGGGSNYVKGLSGKVTNTANGNAGGMPGNMGIGGKVEVSWK
ncbi:MAG: hypothetical protein ABI480_13955 [Chitinophagaceae bacterium]